MEESDQHRQRSRTDDLDFINILFNELDNFLPPQQTGFLFCPISNSGQRADSDYLSAGQGRHEHFINSSGKTICVGHKEDVNECYALSSLFGEPATSGV
jgi:hypothetical protein